MRVSSMDLNVVSLTKPGGNIDNIDNLGLKEVSGSEQKTSIIPKKLYAISEVEKRELPISEKVIVDAIERANEAISMANRRLEFSIHEKTKEIMVKVINTETDEVIREIPPEKMLDMVATIWEMIGIIVDERR